VANQYRQTLENLAQDCFSVVINGRTVTSSSRPPKRVRKEALKRDVAEWSAHLAKQKAERVEKLRRFYERQKKRIPAEREPLENAFNE